MHEILFLNGNLATDLKSQSPVIARIESMSLLTLCLFPPGIEGAFSSPGAKTVIPRKVIGKFSIRLVPDMHPDEVEKQVTTYVEKLFKDRGSPNTMKYVADSTN